jgi:hypothetical protein
VTVVISVCRSLTVGVYIGWHAWSDSHCCDSSRDILSIFIVWINTGILLATLCKASHCYLPLSLSCCFWIWWGLKWCWYLTKSSHVWHLNVQRLQWYGTFINSVCSFIRWPSTLYIWPMKGGSLGH